MNLPYIFSILLLVFGFGFVIFWHELGHFLAAKWVGVKVEQFAVGFGHAILAWRKGIGLRVGTTQREYDRRVKEYVEKEEGHLDAKDHTGPTQEQLNRAAETLGLGETEYRLNWIPLGGYVKMLGQDDLNPNAQSDDPRAFNRKSIPARMLVVSAGVVMNVILAAIGFMVVFMMGFNVPPAIVGGVAPGSPAQEAGLRTGDEIWTYDGKRQYDWTKVQLNVALSGEGQAVPMEVKRNGELIKLTITPRREGGDPKGFLSLGIQSPRALKGVSEKEKLADDEKKLAELYPAEMLELKPGDVITAVNGRAVDADKHLPVFDAALQSSGGAPVKLAVKNKEGNERIVNVQPHFLESFGSEGFNIAGMVPRTIVQSITETSDARGKLKPGDVITSVVVGNDAVVHPSGRTLKKWLNQAGQNDKMIDAQVLRDGREVVIKGLDPSMSLDRSHKGLGIGLTYDERNPVVAEVLPDSAAAHAGIPSGALITAVKGERVATWYDVHSRLAAAPANQPVTITYRAKSGEDKQATLQLNEPLAKALDNVLYTHRLLLGEPRVPRKAANAWQALGWGVTETRDFILQFYVTLRRMVDGTVSPVNLMGPIGIFDAGSRFAYKGHDWLIWFLAMISANLAVVNFLPIPIVDGGLFTFLVLEKIKGRPLSAKTQTIAQFVGMAVLLCVFLFVTYNDIARLTYMR